MNLNNKLITLSGKAGSGKDTVARIILGHDPLRHRYGLADPIKELMNQLFGWDERHSFGELKEVVDPFWGVSSRKIYQLFGTEFGRRLVRDDLWLKKAEHVLQKRGKLIIPDIRFENELDWSRAMGAIHLHIIRPDQTEISENAHVSEQGVAHLLSPDDIIVYNDGSVEDLVKKVNELI